ncbi:MAG: FKBP-type peptidyl-prolyl cis-trans isomerase [Candidatus Handelsmanbacteria bacterium]|nr:FKBP-type peptidyl-prolyl cis-trans isomerase [Candidatus Handelsmanbacteria bacterium]
MAGAARLNGAQRGLVYTLVLLLVEGCGGRNPSSTDEELTIARVSGNEQEGRLGETLADPLVVIVTSSRGTLVTNHRVDFEITEGKGKLSVESAVTTSGGYASTWLTLGDEEGLVKVHAHVLGSNSTADFIATAVAALEPQEQTQVPVDTPTALRDTVTASGLHFIDIVSGTGPAPQAGDVVETHYTGWLEDGTKFDSSLDRGEPLQFVLGRGRVIAGWDEGIAMMRQGGKARLIIPPELGYGARGAGGVIPPNATLSFEVELLRVR